MAWSFRLDSEESFPFPQGTFLRGVGREIIPAAGSAKTRLLHWPRHQDLHCGDRISRGKVELKKRIINARDIHPIHLHLLSCAGD